jgi:hypothetical protein
MFLHRLAYVIFTGHSGASDNASGVAQMISRPGIPQL